MLITSSLDQSTSAVIKYLPLIPAKNSITLEKMKRCVCVCVCVCVVCVDNKLFVPQILSLSCRHPGTDHSLYRFSF